MPLETSGPPSGATPSSVNPQGGRIIQDIERDKASRTKEAGGQRSTVYIGQVSRRKKKPNEIKK